MIETIKLNVGGQLHQVSRSLLEMYPNSMLFKLVSEQWCVDESRSSDDTIVTSSGKDQTSKIQEDEIFIDRDGRLFRHVLNYLRDGKVVLPISIDMDTFIHELSYYGIQLHSDDYSSVSISTQASAQSVLQVNGLIESLEKEECCIRFARFCIMQFKERGNNISCNKNHCDEFQFVVRSTEYGEGHKKKDESLYNAVKEVACGGADMKERSNVYLEKFGLLLNRIDPKDVYRQRTKFTIILEIV